MANVIFAKTKCAFDTAKTVLSKKQIEKCGSKYICNLTMLKMDFTAFDVTKHIRNLVGKNVEVNHKDVRDFVHEYMSGFLGYDRTDDGVKITYKPFKKNILKDSPEVDVSGNKIWRNEKGEFHRVGGPAIEYHNGDKIWYKNDKLHRDDGPSYEYVDGSKYWYIDGKLHREGGPAVEYADGTKVWYLNGIKLDHQDAPIVDSRRTKRWYKNGQLHREDGPAVEYTNGNKLWYKNGQLHREDGPALEHVNSNKSWYKNDLLHREDGPAIEYSIGEKHWYKNGQLHRDDGPAVESTNGDKFWYKENTLHRDNGPAVQFSDGIEQWYTNGIRFDHTPKPKSPCNVRINRKPAKSGLLTVPLSSLGVAKGLKWYVSYDSQTNTTTIKQNDKGRKTNRSGNIRVTKNQLPKFTSHYLICFNGSTIVIQGV